MKTFETEKGNIPEGATHYFDETKKVPFFWFKNYHGIWYLKDASDSVWYTCECSEWKWQGVKPIPQVNIETLEEKEAFDLIDTTPRQHESFASKNSEWNSGDKCIYNGDEFLFVGMIPTLDDFSCVIFSDAHGAKRATTIELSKPETEAERVERERANAIYDMCASADNFTEESNFWAGKFYDLGYRKESE